MGMFMMMGMMHRDCILPVLDVVVHVFNNKWEV